jgi:hypothetical protein
MNAGIAEPETRDRPQRRVREELRDGIAVAVFSAAASSILAVAALLLSRLAG